VCYDVGGTTTRRAASERFALNVGHPKHATHMARRLQQPVVTQLIGEGYPRPAFDGTVTEAHDVYAAYILAVFFADWDWQQRLTAAGGSAWQALTAWEAEADADTDSRVVTRRLIRNADDVAAARLRIRTRARQHDTPIPIDGEVIDADDPLGSGSDIDSDDDVDAHRTAAVVEPVIPANVSVDVDDMLQGLGGASNASAYDISALGPLRNQPEWTLGSHVPSGPEVHRIRGVEERDANAAVDEALKKAQSFDGYGIAAERAGREAAAMDTPEMRAHLLAVARGHQAPDTSGQDVPYVKLDVVPSIGQTARVWSLNDQQSFAFAMMADVLLREKNGEKVPPERMLLLGEPGTLSHQMCIILPNVIDVCMSYAGRVCGVTSVVCQACM